MKKQGFLYGSVILILSVVIVKVIGALFRIPLANMLGGTGMGYFSCAYGIFMIIYAVSVTGLPTAVAKLTAESIALEQYRDVRQIKKISLLLFTATGLVSTAVIAILAYPFCKYVAGNINAVPAVIAIAPSVLFGCIMSVYRGYYEGMRNMYPTAVSQIIEGMVKLISGLGLAYLTLKTAVSNPEFLSKLVKIMELTGFSTETDLLPYAAAAAVLGITISTAMGTVFLVLRDKIAGDGITREVLSKSVRSSSRKTIVKELLKIVIPVAAGSLITNLTSLIDLTTIMRSLKLAMFKAPGFFAELTGGSVAGSMIPTFIFGSFTGLAVSVFNLVPSFTNMFGKGVLPTLSTAFAMKNSKDICSSSYNVLFTTAFISMPAGIGISVLSEPILYLLFPNKLAEIRVCAESLAVLGIGVVFLSLSMSIFSVLQAAGKAQIPVIIMLAGVIVKLIGNTFLVPVPELNVTGAAISTDICYIVIFIISIYELYKITKVCLSNIIKMLLKILISSLMCGATAYLAYGFVSRFISNLFSLAVLILLGALIYIITTHLSGTFTKSTLKMLIS